MIAALAVTSLAAQQTPPPAVAIPQTPPPTTPATQTPPPTGRPTTQTPPTRPPETAPPQIPVMPVLPTNRINLDVRNSTRTWQNVGIEVTISDSLTADVTTKKTVSLMIVDGESGQVRSAGAGTINVDVVPSIRPDGRVFLRLILEYLPDLSGQQTQNQNTPRTTFNESLALMVVPDGKPMIASQTSDPRSDRKVTVQIAATVVK
jgi:hypothetical protein